MNLIMSRQAPLRVKFPKSGGHRRQTTPANPYGRGSNNSEAIPYSKLRRPCCKIPPVDKEAAFRHGTKYLLNPLLTSHLAKRL